MNKFIKFAFLAITPALLFSLATTKDAKAYQYDSTAKVYKLQQNDTITGNGTAKLYYAGTPYKEEFYEWDDWYSQVAYDYTNPYTVTTNGQTVSLDNNYWVNDYVEDTETIINSYSSLLYVDVNGLSNISVTGTNNGAFTFVSPVASTGSETIKPGSLRVGFTNTPFTFPSVKLDGTNQTVNASVPSLNIIDATGSQKGWNVYVSATPFTEVTPTGGFKSGTTAKTFNTESFTIKPSQITSMDSASLTGVTANTNRQNLLGGDVIIASATKGNGVGKYQLQFATDAIQLQILNTKPYVDAINYPSGGTPYQSTLNWKIVVAP